MTQSIGRFALAAAAVATLLGGSLAAAQQPPQRKRLIEYGWDVPNPDYVRQHIRDMEKLPFDGLILRMAVGGQVFTKAPWSEETLQQDFDNLKSIQWDKFTDNFLVVYAASDVDWFSDADWQEVCHKATLTARGARLGHCKGVCFDFEPYGTNPWEYPKQPQAKTKPFAEYQAKVRQRGAEFMRALRSEMPELVFHTFFLLSYYGDLTSMDDLAARQARLSQNGYGLLPGFVNGLLDAAEPGVTITDGNEGSYYYQDPLRFYQSYHTMRQDAMAMVAPENTRKYQTLVQAAQALYVDYVFKMWPNSTPAVWLNPEERAKWFEHNVYYALTTSDQYVWLYSEKMNWWTNTTLPPGLEQATRSGREKAQQHRPLGFDLRTMMEAAAKRQAEDLAAKLVRRSADITRLPAGVAPPVIDGDLAEPAWEKATVLEPFVLYFGKDGKPEAATAVRVAYDDRGLYVAVRCDEPKTAALNIAGDHRDDDVWTGDSVDLFLGPPDQAPAYYHFIINPKGVRWDAACSDDQNDTSYDPEWACAAKVVANAWQVEAAIPWAALKMKTPAAGSELKANVCRQRVAQPEQSTWSQCLGGFVEPASFGKWTLR